MKLTFMQIQLVELKHHSVDMAYTRLLQTVTLHLMQVGGQVYLDYFIIAGGGGGGGNHGAGGGVGVFVCSWY